MGMALGLIFIIVGIILAIYAFIYEPDEEYALFMWFTSLITIVVGAVTYVYCGCDCRSCQERKNNGKCQRTVVTEQHRKNQRTVAAEQRRKTVDTHQKFLDTVKDDPDFNIYFEPNN